MRLTWILSLISLTWEGNAQIDSILALPENHQVWAFWQVFDFRPEHDSTAVFSILDKAERDCRAMNAELLRQQVWLCRKFYRARAMHNTPDGARILQDAMYEARESGWDVLEAECMISLGSLRYQQKDFAPAFEFMIKGYERLHELGFSRSPHTLRHVATLGYAYYHFADYPTAIMYLRQTLGMPPPWNTGGFHRHTLNTIGLCFREMTHNDSAIVYFQKAHAEARIAQDTFWAALANGNLGHVYFLQQEFDKAIPLIHADYMESVRAKQNGSALNAALNLAAIHAQRGEYSEARDYLSAAGQFVESHNLDAMRRYYEGLYQVSRQQGDLVSAVVYADSLHFYRDKSAQVHDAGILERTQQRLQIEKHSHDLRLLEARRNRQVLIRDGILIIVLLSAIIFILWINRQRLLRQKALELEMLKKQAAEKELKDARMQLQVFADKLREKSERITAFEEEMTTLRGAATGTDDERHAHLSKILNATILTDAEWREFRFHFDKVYPHFFVRLKERISDLTQADYRMLAMTKLELAPREMVAMLGVGYDAVKKSRKRLMKRLGLPEDANLQDFVNTL